jgi:hypothetical protein
MSEGGSNEGGSTYTLQSESLGLRLLQPRAKEGAPLALDVLPLAFVAEEVLQIADRLLPILL